MTATSEIEAQHEHRASLLVLLAWVVGSAIRDYLEPLPAS